MRVEVCEGVSLTNPIGDGQDYRGGAILNVSDGKAASWIKLGWVKDISPPVSKPVIPHEEPWPKRQYR